MLITPLTLIAAIGICGTAPQIHKLHERESARAIKVSKNLHAQVTPKQEAILILENSFTDYSSPGDIIESLSKFVCQTTGRAPLDFQIKEPEEIGYSGNKVYQVIDQISRKPFLFIKTFTFESKDFLPEVFSLNFLSQAGIPKFNAPNIQALGKCYVGNKGYFLLSESVAPGRSFLQLYIELADYPLNSAEREKHLTTFLRGIRECGSSLARFHMHSQGVQTKLHQDFVNVTRGYLTKTIEKLHAKPQKGIDIEKLKAYFDASILNMESKPFRTTLIHGDTKFINVFYDSTTNRVTWIDVPNLYNNIDSLCRPIGIPAKDVNSFITEFELRRIDYYLNIKNEVCTREILTQEETKKLLEQFELGYKEVGGIYPTEETLNFFSLAAILYYVGTTQIDDKDYVVCEPQTTRKRMLNTLYYKDLASRLNKLNN